MLARIATQMSCTENELWQAIGRPDSLRFVASPLLAFVPLEPTAFDSEWEVGRRYPVRLYLLRLIPLGLHTIQLETIDRKRNIISSRESGLLAPVWNHNISFQELKPGLVSYRDEIEIRAGWLTPLIWLFAHGFYRHRQRRWKVLLRKNRT
jgi:hypothetical protein